ncbi:hypothetical protein MASR2M15_00890 [Anaerolineales bacterium]
MKQTEDKNKASPHSLNEWVQAFTLLGFAIYLLFLLMSGNLAHYINLRFTWLIVLAMGSFGILGIYKSWILIQRKHEHHAHSVGWMGIFIMLAPLLIAMIVPSQPLGYEAIVDGVSSRIINDSGVVRMMIRPEERTILDWSRELNLVNNSYAFDGQMVDVIGFIYREPQFKAGDFMLSRFTISCCVAEAVAIGLPARGNASEPLEDGQWVRVQGKMQSGEFDGMVVPIIQVDSIDSIPVPDKPYLYH